MELGLADSLGHLVDQVDHLDVDNLGHLHGLDQDIFGHSLGARFDHNHAIAGPPHDQVQRAVVELLERRIAHQPPVHIADAGGRDRPIERNVRDGEGRRRPDDGQDIRVVLLVRRERGDDDLNVVPHSFGEQRPQRPVGEAHRQNGALGRPPLTAEKAARYLPRCVEPLFVVDGQREEVDAFPWVWRRNGGDQDQRVAVADGDGPVGLPGQAPAFDPELLAGDFAFKEMRHCLRVLLRGRCGKRKTPPGAARLSPKAEPLDQGPVAVDVLTVEVGQQPPSPTDELEQPSPRVVVPSVLPEVVGDIEYPVRQSRYLDLW